MHKFMKYGVPVLLLLALGACASQPAPPVPDVPGFFSGLWHGAIAPLAFVGGLFTDIRMYAFPNTGSWYDFGFLIGLSIVWGGGGVSVAYNR